MVIYYYLIIDNLYGSYLLYLVIEDLECGWLELRCDVNVKFILDFEELV